jgi:nucleoid-associated protein YgaU
MRQHHARIFCEDASKQRDCAVHSTARSSRPAATKIREVKSGDSLSKIAKQEYGDAGKWQLIFEANTDILKDPNKIFPGQKLKIPPLA